MDFAPKIGSSLFAQRDKHRYASRPSGRNNGFLHVWDFAPKIGSSLFAQRGKLYRDMRADRADEIRRFSSKITSDSEQTPCSPLPSCEYLLSS